MFAEIIAVGAKHSKNDVDTNSTFISKRFIEMGIDVKYVSNVGDDETLLAKSLYSAVNRSELIIFLGGIDVDEGDITKRVIEKCIGPKMRVSQPTLKKIKDYSARTGRFLDDGLKTIARVFDKAMIFPNEKGIAPGQALRSGEQTIFVLPANTHELQAMMEPFIAPYAGKLTNTIVRSKTLKLIDITAAEVNEKLGDRINSRNPLISGYEGEGEILLRITAKGNSEGAANKLCVKTVQELSQVFNRHLYGNIDENLSNIVVDLLKNRKTTLSTAESCTAGLLSQQITDVPGSSQIFSMGVSTYSNEMKTEVLGVPTSTLNEHGAVSVQVAREMAKLVREKSQSDIGVSITGIAGPDGGTKEKPVGLVYIALADKDGIFVRKCDFAKGADVSRDLVRTMAANTALDMVRLYLLSGADNFPGRNSDDISEYLTSNDPDWAYGYTIKTDRTHYEPRGKRFLKYFIPWAGDGIFEVGRKILLNSAIATMAVALVFIGSYYMDLWASAIDTQEWRDYRNSLLHDFPDDDPTIWEQLRERFDSESLVGWIEIPGIVVDYPVFQGPDNDLYLDHTFAHVPNRAGEIFIDYRNVLGPSRRSTNVTIYGHSMANGTKFGQLNRYMPNRHVNFLNHYREHHHITFDTIHGEAEYVIFAAFVIHVRPNEDNGRYPFHYRMWDFGCDESFRDFVHQVQRRSFFNAPPDALPVPGDYIINLSTCAYDFYDARLAVFARRIREGESRDFDMSLAHRNPNPLKPAAWHARHGGTQADFYQDGFITNMPFWPNQEIQLVFPGDEGFGESRDPETEPESRFIPPQSEDRFWGMPWSLPPTSFGVRPPPQPASVAPAPSLPTPVSSEPPSAPVSEPVSLPPESFDPDPVTSHDDPDPYPVD